MNEDFPRVFVTTGGRMTTGDSYIVLLGPPNGDDDRGIGGETCPGLRIWFSNDEVEYREDYFVDLEGRGWKRIL